MSENLDCRKLSELRVVDLRSELDKRGLDKSGVKKDLVERLQKVAYYNYLLIKIKIVLFRLC